MPAAIQLLLTLAVVLPFLSFPIRRWKWFAWVRNGLVVIGILVALYLVPRTGESDLSKFFAALFLAFGLILAIHSLGGAFESSFYSLLLFILSGLVGIAFADDLFSFFMYWELMLLAAYCLVCLSDGIDVMGAALKYILMSVCGSACLIFAISLVYGMVGSVDFQSLSGVQPIPLKLILGLLMVGFGVESLLFPFHFWAPDLYQASEPSIASIFASLLSKSGVLGLIRMAYHVLPFSLWDKMLAAISLATALFGNLASLSQTDLKRFLAFVSMAHLGFVSFAISIASEIGLASALFHAFNHATLLMLLFFCLKGFGGLKLGELRIESDFHRFAFLMGGLAASGMPPFNNFLSELLILLAAMERGWFAFSGFLLLNLFLTLLAFLRILKCVMTTKVPGTSLDPSMLPISILIALSLFTGIYPSPLLAWLIEIAKVTI